jgi:hypothetical protein
MRRGGATRCGNSGELPRTKQGTRTATCGTVSSSPPHGSPDLLHVEGEAAQREIDSGGARARVWSSGLRRCLRCGRTQACGGAGMRRWRRGLCRRPGRPRCGPKAEAACRRGRWLGQTRARARERREERDDAQDPLDVRRGMTARDDVWERGTQT